VDVAFTDADTTVESGSVGTDKDGTNPVPTEPSDINEASDETPDETPDETSN
jgi:hypothetical protein